MHPRNFKLALARAIINHLDIYVVQKPDGTFSVTHNLSKKELADLIEQTIIEQGG